MHDQQVLDALREARRCIGDLIVAIEKHHSAYPSVSEDLYRLAKRSYGPLDQVLAAIKHVKEEVNLR